MEEFAFLQPLLLTITGLVIGALLKSILKHSRFPYTVGLFGIGLLVGILNRSGIFHSMPQITEAVDSVANINPDLILYLFLPILIFDAAYELNMHIFKKTLANATLLAAPGLVICMILTGVLMVGIGLTIPGYENWTWAFALMFGALISATDPVAVVALLHELKTSKRFSTLVDAESLLNDGTGIVCFMLFFGVYAATGGSDSSPIMEFIKVISISTILGYFLARRRDDTEQCDHPFGLCHLYCIPILFGCIGSNCPCGIRPNGDIRGQASSETAGKQIYGTFLGTRHLHSKHAYLHHSRYSDIRESDLHMERFRSAHSDIYIPKPIPLRNDFYALSGNEKNGLRTYQT